MAELGLDIDVKHRRRLHNSLRHRDVFLIRPRGAVHHDGREAGLDAAHGDLVRRGVVEMHGDRHIRVLGELLCERRNVVQADVGLKARIQLNDQRNALALRRFRRPLDGLIVEHVDCGDAVMVFRGVLQNVLDLHECHCCYNSFWKFRKRALPKG